MRLELVHGGSEFFAEALPSIHAMGAARSASQDDVTSAQNLVQLDGMRQVIARRE